MLKIYPAIFHCEAIGYWVEFPDLPGCQTQGDSLEEAITMSQEALGLYLVSLEESHQPLPDPSNPINITTAAEDFVTLISTDIAKYRPNRAVKKTLTIPQWLNDEAEAQHINFSQVLQQALTERLGH